MKKLNKIGYIGLCIGVSQIVIGMYIDIIVGNHYAKLLGLSAILTVIIALSLNDKRNEANQITERSSEQ